MGNKLFDNLLKIIQGASVFTGTTLVSLEIDFELPRGFVAKIRYVELRVDRMHEDHEANETDNLIRYRVALIKDPDDITTISLQSNRVQHDVLMDLEASQYITLTASGNNLAVGEENNFKQIYFDQEGVDVITARNMRLNIDAEGTDGADATEAFGICIIHYTLEKVSDNDILNLLDIL